MIRLQHCADCGRAQYPPREFCGACLSDRLEWQEAEAAAGHVLARTRQQHSNEPRFHSRLPLVVGLARLDAGPVVVCFLTEAAAPGDAVRVAADAEGLLHASVIARSAVTKQPGSD